MSYEEEDACHMGEIVSVCTRILREREQKRDRKRERERERERNTGRLEVKCKDDTHELVPKP